MSSTTSSTGAERYSFDSQPDSPPDGDRWSTWDAAHHGPEPRPDWVVTAAAACDEEHGVLKTGKEADVHVVRRFVPGTATEVFMAAKRFRSSEHRMFHRDAGYLEGRRVRRSREMRAMARRTEFGRELAGVQWASAEFATLCELWQDGLPVPYPVSLDGQELLMELIGGSGVAAPRLAQTRPTTDEADDWLAQLRRAMRGLAARGWAHGDLSAYNVLVDDGRIVIIDWPQVVDIVGNPRGLEYLQRDCANVCTWFTRAGLDVDPEALFAELVAEVF